MSSFAHHLTQLPAPGAYGLVAVAILAESVLLLGPIVPTLTIMLTAGTLARTGQLDLPIVISVAVGAVLIGDALGHRTGLLLGSRLRIGRLGRRIPAAAWQRATDLMNRRGGQAVFVCRFLPVLRTVAPHLAGATGLPYRRIAPFSAAAALPWAGAEAGIGYSAAAVFGHLADIDTRTAIATAVAVILIVVIVIAALLRIRHSSPVEPVEPRRAAGKAGGLSAVGPVPTARCDAAQTDRSLRR
ncbi:DedA family protein [Nocardia colli]|uniref:DedA family protein n=1 Tax=Nocardia colli TaxID=2545717 RepID=UPI001CC4AA22|nr:DedA family protein [Nocardia colli]